MEIERAERAIARIPPGATLVTESGLLRITRTVADDGKTPAVRWQCGQVVSVPDISEEKAGSRLSKYRDVVLDGAAVFGADGAQVGASKADGEWGMFVLDFETRDPLGPPDETIHGHIEAARVVARSLYNERGGVCSIEIRDMTTGKTKETITRKVETVTESTTKNGSKKTTKEAPPLPRGFKVGVGADLEIADQVVTDEKNGPERIVFIGSGGVSRGREYLKLMLEPPAGGEARRRFISPRKEYPMKKATKAEAEKIRKRIAAEKEAPKKGALKKALVEASPVAETSEAEAKKVEA